MEGLDACHWRDMIWRAQLPARYILYQSDNIHKSQRVSNNTANLNTLNKQIYSHKDSPLSPIIQAIS
jgi:hypothetical protein